MSIKVQGINKAIKQLEKYSDEVRHDVFLALDETVGNVHREASFKVPVDHGNLKGSIQIGHPTPQKLEASVSVNANYAAYVEFGTRSKVEIPLGLEEYALQFKGSNDGTSIGVPARPFLFPAWEKQRPRLMKALTKLLKR